MSVEDKIIAIVAQQAFVEPADIKPASTLEELGVDSMALVECIFAIEETFDVQIPFNANAPETPQFDISSIQTLTDAVKDLIAQQKA